MWLAKLSVERRDNPKDRLGVMETEHGNYRNYRDFIRVVEGYWGISIIGIMENGNYYSIIGYILGYIGVI